MPLYFMVHDAGFFQERMQPAFAAAARLASLEPLRDLAQHLIPSIESFRAQYFTSSEEPLLARITQGLPYHPDSLRLLISETLLFGAAEIPELETSPDALRCFLGEKSTPRRSEFGTSDQVHFGSRDLRFAAVFYRPEHAGFNNAADVARLARALEAINTDSWSVQDLQSLTNLGDEEERAEELSFTREWFAPLADLYRRAADRNSVIVSEML